VSRRIKEYGLSVLAGDLICIAEPKEVLDVDQVEDNEGQFCVLNQMFF